MLPFLLGNVALIRFFLSALPTMVQCEYGTYFAAILNFSKRRKLVQEKLYTITMNQNSDGEVSDTCVAGSPTGIEIVCYSDDCRKRAYHSMIPDLHEIFYYFCWRRFRDFSPESLVESCVRLFSKRTPCFQKKLPLFLWGLYFFAYRKLVTPTWTVKKCTISGIRRIMMTREKVLPASPLS
jgi:hypothetical protein